ncbi:hypothetical protein APV28_3425 [Comamonas testosteroni]|nr:hypothetical protein APV28_3425 [Comamonas testosteroni]
MLLGHHRSHLIPLTVKQARAVLCLPGTASKGLGGPAAPQRSCRPPLLAPSA